MLKRRLKEAELLLQKFHSSDSEDEDIDQNKKMKLGWNDDPPNAKNMDLLDDPTEKHEIMQENA